MGDFYSHGSFGFISRNAVIGRNCIIAPTSRIFGAALIKDNVVIDHNVVIGYPSPKEQLQVKSLLKSEHFSNDPSFDELWDSWISSPTTIEEGCFIRSGTVIYSGSNIGQNVDVAHNVMIRENSAIGRDTQVITGAQIMASVIIGKGCRIAGTMCNRTEVGNCTSMLGHAMHKFKVGVPGFIEPSPKIGNGVIIGRESSIVGGVTIGDYAIVGAGAVITRSIPSCTIWLGSHAVQVKTRSEEEFLEVLRKVQAYENE